MSNEFPTDQTAASPAQLGAVVASGPAAEPESGREVPVAVAKALGSRARQSRASWLAGMVAVVLGLSACGGEPVDESAPSWTGPPPTVTSHALLDWDASAVVLPIDAFGMSPREASVVFAAQNILFARCAGVSESDMTNEIASSAKMLSQDYVFPMRLYGFWDAAYVARNGFDLMSQLLADKVFYAGQSLAVDPEVRQRCYASPEVAAMNIVVPRVQTSEDDPAMLLSRLSFEASDWTTQDQRWVEASESMGRCLGSQGYSLEHASKDGPPTLSVEWSDSWSVEQRQSAVLASAQCNDSLGITQSLGDVGATYQQFLIDEHEAELLAVRVEVESRLERAHQILREAGLE